MKAIIRNLISVIRRFKLAMTLNILGLSVAFAAFMIIMIQLDYDYGFDKFHKDYDKIFRVERGNAGWTNAIFPRPFVERLFESSPHILAGAITGSRANDIFFHVEKNGERNFYEEKMMSISPEFTDVFTLDFVEGSEEALKTPENVIIPLSMARKLFGNESAISQQLVMNERVRFTVGAVYRDFPSNSIFENSIFMPIPPATFESWGSASYCAYIRVNDPANVSMLFENFTRIYDDLATVTVHWADGHFLRFTALSDVHYVKGVDFDYTPKSSKQTLLILLSIAIMIIAIASINFTNFSTALTPMRIKSINTLRVLGVRRNTIRLSIIFEAVIISLLSYMVALLLVVLFNKTQMAQLVDGDLSFAANPLIIGGTALVALLAGLFAGLYPSRYITSFAPALVLKGSFGLSPTGRRLRNTLIGIQFVTSLALIVGAAFMYLQNDFMQNSPLGYDTDNFLTVDIRQIRENRDAITSELKTYSGIEDITYGMALLASSDLYSATGLLYKEEQIWIQTFPVYYNFLKVMGIEITEGRDFREEDVNIDRRLWIFNEIARKEHSLEINTFLDNNGGDIIGFIPDIKFASFRREVIPMGFVLYPESMVPGGVINSNAYIKLNAGTNVRAAMSHISSTLAKFNPDYPFEVRFFDEVLQRLYEKERALNSLISLFSLLAVFISIVGVFGLVVFDSECRRKEIGIRKVLGASTLGIIIMFNKAYFKILTVCFVIAAPLAWYAITRWLENFAYKTPMYWWVYLLAFVAVAIITACTVTFQNWRAATANPVEAIKSE